MNDYLKRMSSNGLKAYARAKIIEYSSLDNLLGKKDIIVLAGKGHEPYQEINGVKHPFDERIIVHQIIKGEI